MGLTFIEGAVTGKRKGYTSVMIGEPGDDASLRAVTLEVLGLELNPFNRTLEPLHGVSARGRP